jgi:hypothetical protein
MLLKRQEKIHREEMELLKSILGEGRANEKT